MASRNQEAVYRALVTNAMTQIARDLRQRETPAEDRLWSVLRDRRLAGLKFRRQHPIAGTVYVVDFLCYTAMLVIEVDGGIHDEQITDDKIRQENIEALGYPVIRFQNEEVLRDLQSVLVRILMAVRVANEDLLGDEALTPNPSPSGRGEQKPGSARPANHAAPSHNQTTNQTWDEQTPIVVPNSARLSGSPLLEGEGLGVRAHGHAQQETTQDNTSLTSVNHATAFSGSPRPEGKGPGVRADTDTAP